LWVTSARSASGSVAETHDYTLMLHGTSGQVSINGMQGDLHLDAQPGEIVAVGGTA